MAEGIAGSGDGYSTPLPPPVLTVADAVTHTRPHHGSSPEPKLGYKKTDVGVIPEDWEVRPLASITEPTRPISYGIVQTGPNVLNGIRCLRVLDIDDGRIAKIGLITTSARISEAYKRTVLKAGDLVMPLRGKVGDVGLVDEDLEGANLTRGVALIALRPGWSSAFFQQLISWTRTRQRLAQAMNGSALQEIPIATLRSFPVPCPGATAEQSAIAEALSDMDALLGALDRLIAKKRDLKQAAMQQLLTGQTRLPGFQDEWEVQQVLDLGAVVTGGTPRTDVVAYWGEGYPWITPTDVSTVRDMFTSERSITANGLKTVRALPANAVLVTCIASIGKNAVLRTRGACNQQINAVIPNKKSSADFLYYMFEASKQYLLANAGTTATSIISKATFESLTFKVPSLSEQNAIAEVLSTMDSELEALEQRRDKIRALKQGMMQELLTGRTRLV